MAETEESEIIVCAGPPVCSLQGDEAIFAADAGCPYCKHIILKDDGTETEFFKKVN